MFFKLFLFQIIWINVKILHRFQLMRSTPFTLLFSMDAPCWDLARFSRREIWLSTTKQLSRTPFCIRFMPPFLPIRDKYGGRYHQPWLLRCQPLFHLVRLCLRFTTYLRRVSCWFIHFLYSQKSSCTPLSLVQLWRDQP